MPVCADILDHCQAVNSVGLLMIQTVDSCDKIGLKLVDGCSGNGNWIKDAMVCWLTSSISPQVRLG